MSKSPIYQRHLVPQMAKLLKQYPLMALVGPRQSGKTTSAHLVGVGYTYINLELLEYKTFALEDPRGFLEQYKQKVILDEAQVIPELFPYLQYFTDKRKIKGEYILSGSQNFLLMEKIAQSLAGRIAIFVLLPLSLHELMPYIPKTQLKLSAIMFKGFYPRLWQNKQMQPTPFFNSYIKTYIERDVKLVLNVSNSRTFRQFIKICASRVGTIFNAQDVSKTLGIDNKTVANWMAVLEKSYIAYFVQPYHENFEKRVVKKPKIYFYDTGLLCYLLDIKNEGSLLASNYYGSVFENFVINEVVKNKYNKHEEPDIYFWQDSNQKEVDLVVQQDGYLDVYEIKSGKTINPLYFKNLASFKNLATEKGYIVNTHVIYGGDEPITRSGHKTLPWYKVADVG